MEFFLEIFCIQNSNIEWHLIAIVAQLTFQQNLLEKNSCQKLILFLELRLHAAEKVHPQPFWRGKKLQIFNFPRIILNCTMKSCFEFESTNRIAKKDTKITVNVKTYVKPNAGGALLFGGIFSRTDFCLKNKLSLS